MQFLFIAQLIMMIIGPAVRLVLRMLGVGFVTYVGYNIALNGAESYIMSRVGSSGVIVQQMLGMAKFDVIVNIYLSAITTRMVLSGLDKAADLKRKQVWRAPGGSSIEA
ncbi:hypothetical protein D9M71_600470 [compost metagenome]|uniref:DUF2523 domain-containing protein n=2 Tax=Pseudomonas sp. DY-1 TaxID=1755504 RepID=UPI000EA95DEC|nr:DUF2523 domain-containing protein [Pseudomonas sp. DY-1]AYF85651.1 DUF2523 domain-containing protein [Pseudomonas sp. DY-1]AYF85671.1 DUF2523 domain-containing protein [Pseudomonas sp. DY-1]AYF85688.1 DUF2523 domain-containing protein [Pseudomonas sp. DY-1]AYF85706.1 DUF2523 domain-containing protein [Pseudomonas sp. DY-1]